jgi:hypothetical protein
MRLPCDRKLFAASLQINLIEEEEFDRFDKAIIYPDGSSRYPLCKLNKGNTVPVEQI